MKFKTQFTKTYKGSKGKKMSNEVLTVPDQNLSVRELLDRHSRGLPIGASAKDGQYFDTEVPVFDDILDMVEYKKELVRKHKELTKQIEDEQNAQKQKIKDEVKLDLLKEKQKESAES